MNKAQLINAVTTASGLSHNAAAKAVEAVLEAITDAVASGEKVTLVGFGTFEATERSARTARNPQTGETVQVPAKKAPKFKAAQGFKDAVKS